MKRHLFNVFALGTVFFVCNLAFVFLSYQILNLRIEKEIISPVANVAVLADEGVKNSENLEVGIIKDDARVLLTRKYLERYKSPLVEHASLIVSLADTYGFDYKYILAIGQQESNLCKKIPENSHNCWGYGIHKRGTLMFDNYDLALRSYTEYLSRVYFTKGLTTPELIETKYNPSSNGSWAWGVNYFLEQIEKGNF